jgi:Protein of unknown function (DUF1648)
MRSMSIEFFMSRVGRYFSALAFVVILLFTYRGLPDFVAVHFDANNRGDGFMPKEQIFYWIAGIVLVSNVLPIILAKVFMRVPAENLGWISNKNWIENRKELNESFTNWMNFLVILVNGMSIITLRILLLLNDDRTGDKNYSYILVVSLVLLMIWIFYFPIKILYTNPDNR